MIKPLKLISAKTKILLLALLFVILPSSILGYLGFRSIEDRGLRLKDNYQGLASLIRNNLESHILSLEEGFLRDITAKNWDKDIQAIQHQLSRSQEQNSFLDDIFIMDVEGGMIHPKMILNKRAETQPLQSDIQARINEFINSGERYEFFNQDYPMAIRSYRSMTEQSPSPQIRSYARMLIARCYFKMRNYRKAEEEYIKLVEGGELAYSSEGTPLKIIGLYQLSETYGLLEESQKKYRSLLELYEALISAPNGFDSYDFYLQSVKDELSKVAKPHDWDKSDLDRLERLGKEEEIQLERARDLQTVQRALLPQITVGSTRDEKEAISRPEHPEHYLVENSDGSSFQIGYIPLYSPAIQKMGRVLIYKIDEDYVLNELLSDAQKEGNLGNNVQLGIYSEEEPMAYPQKTLPPSQVLASVNLSQYFPSWKLVLFDKKGKTIELIVRREKQLYGAVLLGVFGIILAGIVLTLKAALHEAKVARIKSEFVSSVSHELKTPLALIRLFGETLELDQVKDAKQRRKFSRIISRESQRLSHLIENVLDFSKIDSGRKEYNFEEVDLVKLVSNTLEAYKFYLRDQGFEFAVSLPKNPIFIPIDRDAISQAILNLLDNAEKYSKENKFIGVKVDLKNGEVWISIEDKGSGIPKSSLKHVFDKFYRSDHEYHHEVQGSGLGLTIVKHIVESHGGEVRAESQLGKGSRFIIKLPVEEQKGVQ